MALDVPPGIQLRGSNIKVDLVADDNDVQKKSSSISIKTFNKFIDDVTSTSPVLIEVEVRKKRYRQVVSYAPPQYLSFLFLLNVLHHSY